MNIIEPKPQGVMDWTIAVVMLALAVPVVLTFGPVVLLVRAMDRKGR